MSRKCRLDILYIYSGKPLSRPPTGRHSIGRGYGAGGGRVSGVNHTCISKGFAY